MVDPQAKEMALARLEAALDEPLPSRRVSAAAASAVAESEMSLFLSAQQA